MPRRSAGPSTELRLPGLLARVVWPGADAPAPAPALVLLVDPAEADAVYQSLAEVRGVLSLIVPARGEAGAAAGEWLADHAAELGADADRIVVATVGSSGVRQLPS
jgi:nucleotide-binding universal stress UspA family protein